MFGPVNTGDPKIEMARRMASQASDEAITYETAKARMGEPRFIGGGINLDSPEAIDKELFAPIRHQYGIPDPVKKQMEGQRLFEIGNKVVAVDPRTGEHKEIYSAPDKTPVEKPVDWQFSPSSDPLAPNQKIRLTPSAFAEQITTLPEFARTNAVNLAQLRGFGFDGNGMRFAPPSTNAPTATVFASPQEVASAVKAGKLDRTKAVDILRKQFGFK